MDNYIFTIGREFGSGGRDIGFALAEKMGIRFFDRELLTEAAKNSGLCEEIFENHDEKPTSSFLYSLVMDSFGVNGYASTPFLDMPLNHKVFLAQLETIKKIAEEESCVIVGRCADYALSEHKNVINIFIHADLDYRIANIMKAHDLSEPKAKELIQKKDKQRASYYNYYTSKRWGDCKTYDISIDSSKLGISGALDVILAYKDAAFTYSNNE